MKNLLIGLFILGLFSFTAIEAGVTIVKQVNPKQTIVKYVHVSESESFIKKLITKGYVVKCISNNGGRNLIIMEKY